ncbi:MAG TPA: M1 family aminopeptidase [Flavobacteriales bacterium]|nr:M1 family aminopeptidase [Flavobacteriales bacterium]
MRHASPVLAALCSLGPLALFAQTSPVGSATRSDSIDLLHTRIELDLTNATNGLIRGDATITFAPRVNGVSTLPLDLILPVDSVVMDGSHLPFAQAGEVCTINLQDTYGPGDTLTVTVSYGGDPPTDPSGFGGFYTLPKYQYDLGVAFESVPHSYGRSWFPCFDNFVERCSFDFLVRTSDGRSVLANGGLQGITDLGNDERLTHWRLDEPIPSYLASVAAGHYELLTDTFPSVTGADIPVILAGLAQDTANMRGSFAHLQDAFNTFERWFGPYRWNRVGYVLTSAGAMEHATNICYPDFAADGTLTYEDLIAHELSHHWFGNLITCATPEEMYINEGFADFCAKLYMEDLYGTERYKKLVRQNHRRVVSSAHLRDGGWFALNAVPSNMTYGETSYKKGSDIGRTLRATLGDSLFSAGMKRVFANNAYMPISSTAFRDSLGAATGTDLADFFNNWIFQPGGTVFMVDSFSVQPDGAAFATTVHVRQRTRGGAAPFSHVPVTVTCVGENGAAYHEIMDLDGESCTVLLNTTFPPTAIHLNADERLALSTTWDTLTVATVGTKTLSDTDLRLSVTNLGGGPARFRVEEFWVPADDYPGGGYIVSPDRWWRVENDLQPGSQVTLRFTFEGRPGLMTAYDQGLVQAVGSAAFHEDSLYVLWRPSPAQAWTVLPTTVTTIGSATDGSARLDIGSAAAGDYTVAFHALPTGIHGSPAPSPEWRYYPDPAREMLTVTGPDDGPGQELLIHDMGGRLLGRHRLHGSTTRVDVSRLPAQTVLLSVQRKDGGMVRLGPLHIVH